MAVLGARPAEAPAGRLAFLADLAGRGFGKTRAGAEWIREQVEAGRDLSSEEATGVAPVGPDPAPGSLEWSRRLEEDDD